MFFPPSTAARATCGVGSYRLWLLRRFTGYIPVAELPTPLITDKDGTIVQSMSFDAWGQRRDASTWDPVSDVIKQRFNTDRTTHGYTGHEQLDQVGLIHMT